MGNSQSAAGQQPDSGSATVRDGQIFASNTRVCVEEPLRGGEVAFNLGCGDCIWPGWVNVDAYNLKADRRDDVMRLDVQDGCIDRIAAIHVIEHLYLWDAKKALQEWRRALKVGGRLILELPCMDAVFTHICARFRKDVAPAPTFSWLPIWGDPRHEDPSMMHKWGYFKSDIQAMMVNAGFGDVRFETARYHFPQRDMRITGVK